MDLISRRNILSIAASGSLLTASGTSAQTAVPLAERPGHGGTEPGPRNLERDRQNQDLLVPPSTDHGTLPNLRFSFSDAHMRLETGGWIAASFFGHTPDPSERCIFSAPVPGQLHPSDAGGASAVSRGFSHKMMAQQPVKTKSGTVRITDSSVFPVATTIAAALIEVDPGGMRELHWHPNTNEWQYYIEGQARLGVFGASGQVRTFDFQAGDVGYVPFATGHYIENTGSTPVRFLEVFKSGAVAPSVDGIDAPRTCGGAFAPRSRGDGGTAQRQDASRSGLEPFRSKIGVYPPHLRQKTMKAAIS
jgi:oxalate decarboxylase/phosphoglucose isomerase-like protein (cupin superfamily)